MSTLTSAPCQGSFAANGLLSFSEEFLWTMEGAGANPVAFLECPVNLSIVVRIVNDLDVAALRDSLDEIVRRHAVLRSRFDDSSGQPVRVIAPAARVPLPEVDLRGMAADEQTRIARHLLAEHVNSPFDLRTDPLLRALLVTLEEEVHVLAITVHHMVFDGGSRQVFVRELGLLYGAYALGEPSGLAEPAASYGDYVAWQRARLPGDVQRRLTQACMARLGGEVELRLPYDRPPEDGQWGMSGKCGFTLSAQEVEGLRSVSRRNGATVAMAMMAVFAAFLHQVAGATSAVIGMPISDRRRREFEDLIGFFTNVMLLRLDLSGEPSFIDLLKRVRRSLGEAYTQQDLPYGCFVEARAEATGKPPAAPFRVSFNFMNDASDARLQMPGLEVQELEIGHPPPALTDLSLQVLDKDQRLTCVLSYNDALFLPEHVRHFAEHLAGLVRAVATMPYSPIGELSPMDAHSAAAV